MTILQISLLFLAIVMTIRQALLIIIFWAHLTRNGRVKLKAGWFVHLGLTAASITAFVSSVAR